MTKTEVRLKEDFFSRDTHAVAKDLLGNVLIRKHSDGRLQKGMIVEVEAYHGFEDKASHASRSKTERNKVMFGEGGHYYTYLIYGIYWNLNIVTGESDFPSAILIRALEPIFDSGLNLDVMGENEKRILASGPGRLCRWMGIDKTFYGKSVENEELYVIKGDNTFEVVTDKRIGVAYAKEAAEWDWRYYIKNNKYVSK